MYGACKVPVLCAYAAVDKPPPPPLPPSPITATLYRSLTLNPNLPKYGEANAPGTTCPFAPFTFESPEETPGEFPTVILYFSHGQLGYIMTFVVFYSLVQGRGRFWASTRNSSRWRRR